MHLTMIAACDATWGIGHKNALPWHIPADMKHFRERTMGRHLIMGRTTFETLPVALKGRHIHVASRTKHEGCFATIDDIIETGRDLGLDEMLVAGGAEIYRQLEPHCSFAEITRIPGSFVCDTYLVNLSKLGWSMFGSKNLTPDVSVEYWRK